MTRSYRQHPLSTHLVLGEDVKLSTTERLVYVAMCSMVSPDGERLFQKSMGQLARATGLSRGTVIRAVAGLQKAKAIELMWNDQRNEDGGRAPNVYRIIGEHVQKEPSESRSAQIALDLLDAIEESGIEPRLLLSHMRAQPKMIVGVFAVDDDHEDGGRWVVSGQRGI